MFGFERLDVWQKSIEQGRMLSGLRKSVLDAP
jgi:hypothetical protein